VEISGNDRDIPAAIENETNKLLQSDSRALARGTKIFTIIDN
jgi:hypothetical protein